MRKMADPARGEALKLLLQGQDKNALVDF